MFSRTCNIYEGDWKIMKAIYRRNVTLVEAYMKDNTNDSVAQKASAISNNNQPDQYNAIRTG